MELRSKTKIKRTGTDIHDTNSSNSDTNVLTKQILDTPLLVFTMVVETVMISNGLPEKSEVLKESGQFGSVIGSFTFGRLFEI